MSSRSGICLLRNRWNVHGLRLLLPCLKPKSQYLALAHLIAAAALISFTILSCHPLSSFEINWETIESQKFADLLQAIGPFDLVG